MGAKRPKRRVSAAHRIGRSLANRINESWSMDFVTDSLFNGRRFRSENNVTLDFNRSGKPEDDAFIESFDRHLGTNIESELVLSLEDAAEKIEP